MGDLSGLDSVPTYEYMYGLMISRPLVHNLGLVVQAATASLKSPATMSLAMVIPDDVSLWRESYPMSIAHPDEGLT